MMMSGLPTARGDAQRYRVLNYMRTFEAMHGYSPSIAGMARALDMQRTAIVWHLGHLRDEGEIDYADGNLARSLRLVDQK